MDKYYAESHNDYLDHGDFIHTVGTFTGYASFVLTASQDDVHHDRECWIHPVYPWWHISWNTGYGEILPGSDGCRPTSYLTFRLQYCLRFPNFVYLQIPSLRQTARKKLAWEEEKRISAHANRLTRGDTLSPWESFVTESPP